MAIQRLFSKLRSFSVRSAQTLPSSLSSRALLRSFPPLLHHPLPFASIRNKWTLMPLFIAHSPTQSLPPALTAGRSSAFPFSMVRVRHVSSRERKKTRRPMTPVTSKLKKTKMKSYLSYKSRFRTMNDGTIRRWRAVNRGKRYTLSNVDRDVVTIDVVCTKGIASSQSHIVDVEEIPIFKTQPIPEREMVKMVASCLDGDVGLWRDHMQESRQQQGQPIIRKEAKVMENDISLCQETMEANAEEIEQVIFLGENLVDEDLPKHDNLEVETQEIQVEDTYA